MDLGSFVESAARGTNGGIAENPLNGGFSTQPYSTPSKVLHSYQEYAQSRRPSEQIDV